MNNMQSTKGKHMYIVTKQFTHGVLRGMTIRERVSYYIRPGHYSACIGSSQYNILKCVKANQVA